MFKRRPKPDTHGYYPCGIGTESIRSGELKKVSVNNHVLILTKLGDEIIAFSDTCPHGAASLAAGSLSKHKISCPDHGYCFDIRSGRIIWPEDEHYRLHRYEVKVDNNEIKVRFDDE